MLALGGSSPRARGTRDPVPQSSGAHRFIPAGAGNTPTVSRLPSRSSVHPRGRGEHLHAPFLAVHCASQILEAWTGSSPRARGTPSSGTAAVLSHRFIPAGAGNTMNTAIAGAKTPVHPRGRGEHYVVRINKMFTNGSSPRARGTHDPVRFAGIWNRFIPAGAGNTSIAQKAERSSTVHPRGRGEHPRDRPRSRRWRGSSPRARGTQHAVVRRAYGSRFIPAGAGNTAQIWPACCFAQVHPRGRGEHSDTVQLYNL